MMKEKTTSSRLMEALGLDTPYPALEAIEVLVGCGYRMLYLSDGEMEEIPGCIESVERLSSALRELVPPVGLTPVELKLDWKDERDADGLVACVGRWRLEAMELPRRKNPFWWSVSLCYGRDDLNELQFARERGDDLLSCQVAAEAWLKNRLSEDLGEFGP